MNKRIYVAEIQEFWVSESKQYSKLNFKVLFNKNEILNYCINHINTSNLKNMEDYDAEITIYEYAYERYEFEHFDGLVLYFNEVTKSSENIYDKILKCIDCNVFKYSINMELVDTYVRTASRNYNITFSDYPLLEEDCIEKYTSKFRYLKENLNKNLINRKTINGLRFVYINIDHEPFDNKDTGNTECLYVIDYNIIDMISLVGTEILSIAQMYHDEELSVNELVQTIESKFKNILVEIYEVTENDCTKVFSTTDIKFITGGK
jgi:hypothetical protein